MEYKEFYILRLDQWLSQNRGELFLEKYKNFFVFSGLKLERSIPENIRKNFFENNMGVFKVGGRKFHSPKYKGK